MGILILPFALFHSFAGLVCRNRVRCIIESLRAASVETRVLREGLELLERAQFRSARLAHLTGRVRGASQAVRTLERLLNTLHERNKEWFYPLSLLLMGATRLCMAIAHWRALHGAALRNWIEAWAEFEALNALANYAYENPGHRFAELSPGGAQFHAVSMGNPLLPDRTCVRNDVGLDSGVRFYVVSGSNMSGKSSLLRAIGLNAVLAFAGAPVPAQSLRLSPLTVCASIAVVDSLLKGKSRFLSEMDRVRQTLDAATGGRPVLFLIDEIFSGTNSRDRRAAAEAVVRTLVDRGAVGALSTHDMSLTEIAGAPELHGVNVHLGAKDSSDPMSFDYRTRHHDGN
jgi:DNA mismatch repair ATPase MutS